MNLIVIFDMLTLKEFNMSDTVKIYLDGERVLISEKEIIVELPSNILKIKGDVIKIDNKNKIKKEMSAFVCR